MSTPNKILTALAESNEYVSLGLEVAGTVVPLVKGAITAIRDLSASRDKATYEVLIEVDSAELDAVDKIAADDLLAINTELAARGVPEVPAALPPTDAKP